MAIDLAFQNESDRRCVHVHDMWNISAFKCSPEERKKISLFAYLIFETKKKFVLRKCERDSLSNCWCIKQMKMSIRYYKSGFINRSTKMPFSIEEWTNLHAITGQCDLCKCTVSIHKIYTGIRGRLLICIHTLIHSKLFGGGGPCETCTISSFTLIFHAGAFR